MGEGEGRASKGSVSVGVNYFQQVEQVRGLGLGMM